MDEITEAVEQLRILGWKEQRGWGEFAGSFKVPSDTKSLEQRVNANFLHYRTNYLIITASVFILRLLLAPMLFLSIVCCAAVSAAAILLIKDPIRIGDFIITQSIKLIGCALVSLLFLALCGAVEHLLWGLLISALLCFSHMIFRPRSISSKSNKIYEEAKINVSGWFGDGSERGGATGLMSDPENPDVMSDVMSGFSGSGSGSGRDEGSGGGSMRKRTQGAGALY